MLAGYQRRAIELNRNEVKKKKILIKKKNWGKGKRDIRKGRGRQTAGSNNT